MEEITSAGKPAYSAGGRELWLSLGLLVFGSFLWNSLFTGGMNLGFCLSVLGLLACAAGYLKKQGVRFGRYSGTLLILSAVLAGGFLRTDDEALKPLAAMLLLFSSMLGFCLATGGNRREPGGVSSALDAPRVFFVLGFGGMSRSAQGFWKAAGGAGKKSGAALLGILLAVPLAGAMTFLLARSDAAFEALVDGLLPRLNVGEQVISLAFGFFTAWVGLSIGLGLTQGERPSAASRKKAMDPITWNVVLGAASLLYCVYLLSQLSYLGGGFAGNLPEGYTLAQYARRGFFEMAWLGAINLGLITLSMSLTERKQAKLTRKFCLFLGGVTLFLVAASSAKMILYIRGFGLTWLRVLTEAFMVWLAVSTVLTMVWLLRENFGYMPGVVITALILCAGLLWADVDAQVARYNVRAYQRGALETIDLNHLASLGDGAVPYLAELSDDPRVSKTVEDILSNWKNGYRDLRGWNAASEAANGVLRRETGTGVYDSRRDGVR